MWLLVGLGAFLLTVGGCATRSAFHRAVMRGDLRSARVLLTVCPWLANSDRAAGSDFPTWRITPLAEALGINNPTKRRKMVALLLASGANPNRGFSLGGPPLWWTAGCRDGDLDVMRQLLKAGADPDFGLGGSSPLSLAADWGFWEGARLIATSSRKLPPVINAAVLGDRDALSAALRQDSQTVKAADGAGRTALDYAVQRDDVAMATELLDAGASVNAKDKDYETALHRAALLKDPAIARLLLERGGSVLAIGQGAHDTPLHLARTAAIAKVLISAGAPVNKPNISGATPLDLALDARHYDVADVLRAHGGREGR